MSARPAVRAGTLSRSLVVWGVLAVTAAVVIGAVAAFDPQMALMLLIMAGLGLAVVIHPPSLLLILILAVLIEAIDVGGITVSRLLAPLALIVIIATVLRGTHRMVLAPPFWWAVAYGIWALASALWTVDFDATVHGLGSLAIAFTFMAAFATLLQSERDLRRVLVALAIGGLVFGAYEMYSFIVGGVYHSDPATGDANFFAQYQLVAIPLLIAFSSVVRTREARIALYVVIAVLVGSVMTSLSRGGTVALIFVALLLLLLPAKTVFRSRRQKVVAFAALVAAAVLVFNVTSASFLPRIETIFAPGQTGAGRTNIWRGAVTSIGERPLLGVGFYGFKTVSNELMLRTPGVDLQTYDLRPDGIEVHNAFLGSLAELGMAGVVLFTGLLISTGRQLRRMSVRARRQGAVFLARVSNALLLGLLGWSAAAMFLSAETSRTIWILIGVSLALPKLLEAHDTVSEQDAASVGVLRSQQATG